MNFKDIRKNRQKLHANDVLIQVSSTPLYKTLSIGGCIRKILRLEGRKTHDTTFKIKMIC